MSSPQTPENQPTAHFTSEYRPKVLRPMTTSEYAAWCPNLIKEYAEEKVRAGNWPAEGAIERSQQEHDTMLPSGVATPGHFFFTILSPDEQSAGILWVNIRPAGQQGTVNPQSLAHTPGIPREAFTYNIELRDEFQGRGIASAALRELELFCQSQGAVAIKLHVFGHNKTAQRLYQHLGYETTNINMTKNLRN